MLDSLKILFFFVLGLACAFFELLPDIKTDPEPALIALWVLMALVGLSIGANKNLAEIIRSLHPSVLLIPLATTLGTFIGAIAGSLLSPLSIFDSLAVGAGFAYYSLSSIFITQYKGPDLGTISLISNILRELFTLVFAPFLVRFFGPLAAISSGGASTMDTTLPTIARSAGDKWVFPSIIHALILDFSVPFWITLFCYL